MTDLDPNSQNSTTPLQVEVDDDRLYGLLDEGATLQKLAGGAVHKEGPVYLPHDDSLIYSDAHGNRLLRWQARDGVTVLRNPSHYQNGNGWTGSTAHPGKGRLIACSSGRRAIVQQLQPGIWAGDWPVLVDRYQGRRLNSPNDLTLKRDGTIWFTDPPYGITQPNQGYGGQQEQPGSYVYRFDPQTQEIEAVITDMPRPNGLVFSPDECLLYVSDSSAFDLPDGAHHVRVYPVLSDRQVGAGRVFAVIDPGEPDGLCVDCQGNLFATSADSVQIYAPDGTRLGKIYVPETCANLAFGGASYSHLFITAGHSLYVLRMATSGVKPSSG